MGIGSYDGDDVVVKGDDGTEEGAKIAAITDSEGKKRLAVDANLSSEHSHLETIMWEHELIHQGYHFTYTDFYNLDNTESKYYLFEVSSGLHVPHIVWGLNVEDTCEIYLIESPSYTKGTALTLRNNNRNYADSFSNVTFNEASNVSGGTVIYRENLPAKSNIPSGSRRLLERILKRNTNYILQIKSNANGNIISFDVSGYVSEEGNGL